MRGCGVHEFQGRERRSAGRRVVKNRTLGFVALALRRAVTASRFTLQLRPGLEVRLDARSIDLIRQVVCTEAGSDTRVRLFGSRVDEQAKGGDVDLLLEMTQAPPNAARLAAAVAGRVSRALHGRRVDVLIDAPGLRRLPIHEVARRQGVLL